MKLFLRCSLALLLLSTLNSQLSTAFAQGTAFTYQGRLNDGAAPANGSYDLQFAVYDAAGGGSKQGSGFITNSAAAVSNGLFTVTLDFGTGVFPGAPRWLDIGVRTNGGGGFTLLAPRQALTATPYAIFAGGASNLVGAVSSANLAGTYSQAVTLNNPGNVFTGNGGGVTNVNAAQLNGLTAGNFWQLGGNNVGAGNFLGSTNNQAVEIKANGVRALRLEPTAGGSPNVIGGSPANFIGAGFEGASIGGGGSLVYSNSVTSSYSTVAGGYANSIRSNAPSSFIGGGFNNAMESSVNAAIVSGGVNLINGAGATVIGGGEQNQIHSLAHYSVIGGGHDNLIFNQAWHSVIAGGNANSIGTNATYVAILGGWLNRVENSSLLSTLGGGFSNLIQSNAAYAAILGGKQNTISSASDYGFIGGGTQNKILSGLAATISGGSGNAATNDYATVSGGYTNSASGQLATVGGGARNVASGRSATVGGGGDIPIILGNYGNRATGDYSTVGGGAANLASGFQFASVGGGFANAASGLSATVGGGSQNTASASVATVGGGGSNQATNTYATVPGGNLNVAGGQSSLAAGNQAKALHNGAFVWADSTGSDFSSTAANQFLVRASGGVGINTSNPVVSLTVQGSGAYNAIGAAAIAVKNSSANKTWEWHVLDDGRMQFADLGAGATRMVIDTAGNITTFANITNTGNIAANTFITTSDRNAKEHFAAVSAQEILAKVVALPITQWNFKSENTVQHVGPMAQDFRAAFGLGPDEKHIATVDADGVAFAAIQGLNEKVESGKRKAEQAETQMTELQTENAELKARLEKLEQLLNLK